MDALTEIGLGKAVRFVFYGVVGILLHGVVVPQIRVAILRLLGARIGSDTIIHDITFVNLYHYGFRRLHIGNRCFLGEEVLVDCRGWITLEDDVTLSDRVCLVSHINVGYKGHPLQAVYPTREDRVIIGSATYLGTGVIVLPGVTIGARSVIGAGAVVTRDIPSDRVAVGVPARVIKRIRKI